MIILISFLVSLVLTLGLFNSSYIKSLYICNCIFSNRNLVLISCSCTEDFIKVICIFYINVTDAFLALPCGFAVFC